MFSDEVQQINDGLSQAEGILRELLDEGLVENAYGDDIRRALSEISEAEDAAQTIENEDDPSDVDLGDMAWEISQLDNSLDEMEGSLEDAKRRAEDIRSTLRDYL